jgi:hypothetical protein
MIPSEGRRGAGMRGEAGHVLCRVDVLSKLAGSYPIGPTTSSLSSYTHTFGESNLIVRLKSSRSITSICILFPKYSSKLYFITFFLKLEIS